jgi:hypothetical protein
VIAALGILISRFRAAPITPGGATPS